MNSIPAATGVTKELIDSQTNRKPIELRSAAMTRAVDTMPATAPTADQLRAAAAKAAPAPEGVTQTLAQQHRAR